MINFLILKLILVWKINGWVGGSFQVPKAHSEKVASRNILEGKQGWIFSGCLWISCPIHIVRSHSSLPIRYFFS
jgi:hypothetical protein